ncbi:MAG TPA: FG-GAP-like repeat-containing protein [Acidimicrobiia bacterium]
MVIKRHGAVTALLLAAALTLASFATSAQASTSTTTSTPGTVSKAAGPQGAVVDFSGTRLRNECAPATSKQATCDSLVAVDSAGNAAPATTGPTGWGANDIEAAYDANINAGSGETIALVDAYSDANIESDLAVYRSHYGFPACTSASGCLTILNQDGAKSPLPKSAKGTGWTAETALDLQMASAVCPLCHLVLVEADSPGWFDMFDAADIAAENANIVSNSYGGPEESFLITAGHTHYDHPGVVEVASSGDKGYSAGAQIPAAFATVTGVGGTVLARNNSLRGFSETAWGGAGSGCSAYVAKPSFQHDTGCPRRTVADIAAVASQVSAYDSLGSGGWVSLSGTSASTPIIAGMYALASDTTNYTDPTRIYQHASSLFDVTSGSNGSCGGSYLCTAGAGYDAPTGLGSPNGTSAFRGGTASLVLDGEAGDPVVGPNHLTFASAAVQGNRQSISFTYSGSDGVWSGAFAPPTGSSFSEREYDGTQQVANATHAAADVRGNGQACVSAGSFAIDDLAFDSSGNVSALAIRWALRCSGASGINRGSIEWNTRVDEPQQDVAPRSFSMGVLLPHAITGGQTITVSNAGTTRLTVGAITASNPAIAISNDTCSNTTVAVGASCTVQFTVSPIGTVALFGGTIVIPDGATSLGGSAMHIPVTAQIAIHQTGQRFTAIPTVGGTALGGGTPIVGDFNADGTDDILWYVPGPFPDKLDITDPTHPGAVLSTHTFTINGSYEPLVGDFNDDGKTDILWYAPGPTQDWFWYGNGDGTFTAHAVTINGLYDPVVGDFDGDGHVDDVLWYGPGRAPDVVWFGGPSGPPRSATVTINGVYDRVVAGDFNGDGADDLMFWSHSATRSPVWISGNGWWTTSHSFPSPQAGAEPVVLRIDGDRRDDLLWYGPGSIRDAYATAAVGFSHLHPLSVNGFYEPIAANFDGNPAGYDDVLWRRVGAAGGDAFWTGTGSGFVSSNYTNTHTDAFTVHAAVGQFNGGDRAADVLLYDGTGNASIMYGFSP